MADDAGRCQIRAQRVRGMRLDDEKYLHRVAALGCVACRLSGHYDTAVSVAVESAWLDDMTHIAQGMGGYD